MNAPARHALWAFTTLLTIHPGLRADVADAPKSSKLTWKNGEALPGSLVAGSGEALSWKTPMFSLPFDVALHAIRQIEFNAVIPAPTNAPTEILTSALSTKPLTTQKIGAQRSVTFLNKLDKDVEIYWMDDNGHSTRYGRIKPGAKRVQPTYEGHIWMIGLSKDDVLAYLQVPVGLKSVIVDGKGKPPAPDVAIKPEVSSDESAPFTLKLRDGSVLQGSLKGSDENTLVLHTASHGDVAVKRSEISNLSRTAGGPVIYPGDGKKPEWNNAAPRFNQRGDTASRTPAWVPQDGGNLKNSSLGTLTRLAMDLPESLRIDVSLRSPKQPQFSLDFGDKNGGVLTLETWGREVVLRGSTTFISLKKLTEDDHAVAMTILWDAKAKRFAAFNIGGYPMGGWQTDSDSKKIGRFLVDSPRSSSFKGVRFTSKCEEVVLERLRISKWDGQTPQKSDPGKPYVRLLDGSVIEGRIVKATPESVTIRETEGGAERSVATALLDASQFVPEPLKDKIVSTARVMCANGDFLRGEFQQADTSALTIRTSFCDQPVPTRTGALTTLKLDLPAPSGTPEDPPLAKMDRVNLGPATLHGRWVADGSPDLKWLPPGCAKAVPLAMDAGPVEISRVIPEEGDFLKGSGLVHLTTGDIVPATVTSLDPTTLNIEAPLLGIKQLPNRLVRCVEFGSGELKTQGFQDAGWRTVRGGPKSVIRDGDKVTLDAGGAYGHPSMLQGDDVRFSVVGLRGMGVVRVRLFCNGTDVSSPSTNILFAHYGSTMYAGLEKPEGQIQNRCQMRVSGKTPCRLQVRPKEIELFINNVSSLKIPTNGEKRSGLGLVFECGDLWGNGPRGVIVSDFSLHPNAGKPWLPSVDTLARSQALLVPRFRKDDPPKHVLVAANGDLLRGELTAATGAHLAFRSGLESLQVPRERVSAAIWLQKPTEKKPDEATPAPAPTTAKAETPPDDGDCTHWLQLISGARFGLHVERFEPDMVIGHSKLVGQCRIPLKDLFKVRLTRPAPDSVTHAFDDWKLEFAPEPVIPEAGAENSPLLGKDAKSFKLPLLDGGDYDFASQKGKVVVLDFWATWCAPCIKSLPGLIGAMAPFPEDKVSFIGVNQGESKEQVSKFLKQRGWKLKVALDAAQSVGRQFGVDGIPHTVIIGPDGKIAWVKTGYAEGNDEEAAAAVKKLIK